jgi:uncharacterized membrane protein
MYTSGGGGAARHLHCVVMGRGWLEGLVLGGLAQACSVCRSVCTGRRRKYCKGWQHQVVLGLWEGMVCLVVEMEWKLAVRFNRR